MRLLLAEDEEDLAKALVTVCKHNGYSVDAVHNGEDALSYLETGIYDGAILDIMMPKMDGLTVVRKLRLQGNSIPVLLLTAKAEVDDRVNGLDAGADDYLTKPFSMKELMARIRAMTRRKTDVTECNLSLGNLLLDRTTYQVINQDTQKEVKLSNKEYQMLEMLMVHPGQIISQEQFMDKIWGLDSEAEQNNVWVYLSYLRKKLTTIEVNVVIKASRGLGYSIELTKE